MNLNMNETIIGTIQSPVYKNGCCEDKPFVLIRGIRNSDRKFYFVCECECGYGWCTNGCQTGAEAIMQYELMCKTYPGSFDFGLSGEKLSKKYFKEYDNKWDIGD